jgi:hypothetical protein
MNSPDLMTQNMVIFIPLRSIPMTMFHANSFVKIYADLSRKTIRLLTEDVVKQDENVAEDAPTIIDPRPNSMIEEYQDEFQGVHYDSNTGQTTLDKKEDE